MKEQRLAELFELYVKRNISEQDELELMTLLIDPELQDVKNRLIEKSYDEQPLFYRMNEAHADNIFNEIVIKAKPVQRKLWSQIAVAASVLLIVSSGIYFLYLNKTSKQATNDKIVITTPLDVTAPAINRATIQLANGQIVYLDSTANGIVATQSNVQLKKLADGNITYNGSSTTPTVSYNTLTNPRGSKVINITLNDGSRVWLNAGSSVTYPVAFAGRERKISIIGEAYFEVAHNAAMPFKVSKGNMEVTVLGTHFNVNAYDDESDIKVTLLEGSVKMSMLHGQWAMLKAGEQAVATDAGKLEIKNGVDMDMIMAWKNGEFQFGEATSIADIMKQIAKWYDLDIEYEGTVTGHIGGVISRNVNLSQVLKMLEMTGAVKFNVEGRKVVVRTK
ncbi:MAG: FecR domain-containing protein [Ginsengibacter sp.]